MKVVPVNKTFWHLTDKLRREKYDSYVAWFNSKKGSQDGLESLARDKAFNAWAIVERGKDGKYAPEQFQPDSWGLFCLNTSDPEKLIKAATINKARNKGMIDEANRHVGGNPEAPLLNPDFVARAEATKELRKKLKDYSGSDELASDMLFAAKVEADRSKQDFTAVAKKQVEDMVGFTEQKIKFNGPLPAEKVEAVKKNGLRWFFSRLTGGLISPTVTQGEPEPSRSYEDNQKLLGPRK